MAHSIETFFAAWADGDAGKVTAAVTEQATYRDPRTPEPLTSAAAMADYVAMFSQHAPGAVAEVVNLSECGPHMRATVAFKMADGMVQHGQYFCDMAEDGRISRMVGFVGTGEPE